MDINQMLSGLLGGLSGSDAAIRAEQPRAAETTAGISAAGNTMQEAIARSIDLGNQASQQSAAVDYAKAAYGEVAQRTANLDPDDLNNAYVRSMAELTRVTAEREASMEQYRNLTETNFLDNPIGYVFNQLALPQVAATHNNLATQQNNLTSDLATRTQLMYQNKTQVTANVAGASLDAKLLEAEANKAAAEAKAQQVVMENFGRVATARMNELALTDKLNQNAATRYSAGMQAANFAAQQQERAEARKDREEARKVAAKDKAVKDAQDGALAAGLARVSGALGYPAPLTLEDFKRMPASKQKQTIYNAAVDGSYGDDLAESLTFLQSGNQLRMQRNSPEFMHGVRVIGDAVGKYTNAVVRKPENAKLDPKEAAVKGAQEYVAAVTLAAHDPNATYPLNDSYWDVTFNPNRPQHASMVAKAAAGELPALAGNSYLKVLQTVAKTIPPGSQEFRGDDSTNAIKALAELVGSRSISLQQAAADLARYSQAAAQFNQDTYKGASLALPVQKNAYVRITRGMFGGGAVIGDTMNQASAEKMLMELAVSSGTAATLKRGMLETFARSPGAALTPTR